MNLNQNTTPLLSTLKVLANKPHAAFYAPGHKRGQGVSNELINLMGNDVFKADLPELPELDNLFAPEGVINEAQQLAATTFGADFTYFLINGSTCGIIAAILATSNPGDKIILPRNVHKSIISGLILSGAIPIFIEPFYDSNWDVCYGVSPESVAHTLAKYPDSKAVFIIYPTYQGICTNLREIAKITHQYNIPLLVDEAHGAHFSFHQNLPPSALSQGADLTVQSTHKTLGSLTQSSMLHIKGDRLNKNRLENALQLMQSTSPNYLLLASLDAARQQMAIAGKELMSKTLNLALQARERLKSLKVLQILDFNHSQPGFQYLDLTRITVDVSNLNLTGYEVDEILHQKLGVTAELPMLKNLTFIISLGNTQADIDKLIEGFSALITDTNLTNYSAKKDIFKPYIFPQNFYKLSPRDAFFAPKKTVAIENSIGCISGELICPYPPGIPILMLGEIITEEAIIYLQNVISQNGIITGCSDESFKSIKIVDI